MSKLQLAPMLANFGISILVINCCVISPAVSQPKQNTPNLWGAPKTNKNNVQPLKESPDLPHLPPYSGKYKFLKGYVQSMDTGWTAYQMNYATKESQQEVKDWYQRAFNMYQWKTLHSQGPTITANCKAGHVCTVIFNNTSQPGYRSELEILYSLAPANQVPTQN